MIKTCLECEKYSELLADICKDYNVPYRLIDIDSDISVLSEAFTYVKTLGLSIQGVPFLIMNINGCINSYSGFIDAQTIIREIQQRL